MNVKKKHVLHLGIQKDSDLWFIILFICVFGVTCWWCSGFIPGSDKPTPLQPSIDSYLWREDIFVNYIKL